MYIITSPEMAPARPSIFPTFGTVKPIIVVIMIAIKLKIKPAFMLIVGSLKITDDTISRIIWKRIGKTVNIYEKEQSQIIVGNMASALNICKEFCSISFSNYFPENPIYPVIPTIE